MDLPSLSEVAVAIHSYTIIKEARGIMEFTLYSLRWEMTSRAYICEWARVGKNVRFQ
jgi:hypothetical protein